MHDIVDMCATAAGSYICDDICRMFQNAHNFELGKSPLAVGAQPTISDEIAYFHGSPLWDLHWKSPATFTLHPDLIHLLSQHQTATVEKHLSKIEKYYNDMDAAGFFTQTANDFVAPVFRSADPACPPYPASAFGAGFSGFDRVDERGWDRAGYEAAADHSRDEWEWRSAHQIAYFIALGRIFEIPAGLLVAYDPCYSRVDVVLLAALGVRALCKGDPALKPLRRTPHPTLFYAPGAEQHVFTDALLRADPIHNLVILGGDATWCGRRTAHFTENYMCIRTPAYAPRRDGEAPCGEENCLQWVPRARVAAFEAARGPAREPAVRQMLMPDGSLEPDD